MPSNTQPAKQIRPPKRIEMLKYFPKGGVYAEIGVFIGTFSARIIENCAPSKIYLVDTWRDGLDWMVNGEIKHFTGQEAYNEACKLDCNPAVRIRRQKSVEFISELPDDHLDVIYLDANHSYESVRDELNLCFPRMKKGGWVSGHDYCDVFSGVKRAVDEFVSKNGLKIDILTDETPGPVINMPDGPKTVAYNSFAIKVKS